MTTVVAIVLLALTVGFILYPLWRARRSGAPADRDEGEELRRLLDQRESTYATLLDLEFDHRLGNLSDADYKDLRVRYRSRALTILKAIDSIAEKQTALDEAIEREVAMLRQSGLPLPPLQAGPLCPRCGVPYADGARFCTGCGVDLVGAPLQPAQVRPAKGRPAAPLYTPGGGRRRWLIAAAGVAALWVAASGFIYFQATRAASSQQPVATLATSSVRSLSLDPIKTERLFAVSSEGIWSSRDGGFSWTQAGPLAEATAVVFSSAQPGLGYATTRDALLKSVDGGVSWQPVKHDLPRNDIEALAVDPTSADRVFAWLVSQGLFESRDGGLTWNKVSQELPPNVTSLIVLANAPNTLYASTLSEGVLASSDGGKRWGGANGFANGALPTVRATAIAFDASSGDRYIAPSGAQMEGALYVGTDRGLFKSIDGGRSWNRLPLEASVAALAIDPQDSRRIFVVDSRGQLFRSLDRGITWPGVS